MLLAVWSPKGGSGTSVLAAACSLVLARSLPAASGSGSAHPAHLALPARLADLAGDQPAVLGLPADPPTGLTDWLAAGPTAPPEALDRLAVDAAPNLVLLPAGSTPLGGVAPEAGAALGVVLRDDPRPTVADVGLAESPAARALVEVADVSVVVARGCYLTLRRGVRDDLVRSAAGVVFIDEPGRALGAREVADVLGIPVLVELPLRAAIGRAVDAGVLQARLPDPLARKAEQLLAHLGVLDREGRAA